MFVAKPGDWPISFREIRSQQQRVVGPFLETDEDSFLLDGHFRGGIDKIAEDVPGLGPFVVLSRSKRGRNCRDRGFLRRSACTWFNRLGRRNVMKLSEAVKRQLPLQIQVPNRNNPLVYDS